MIFANDKISLRQFQILIILDAFGTGMIILPRKLAIVANQDAYIIVIISTIFAMGYMYIIMSVGRIFPKDNFITYNKSLFSKPIAILLGIVFILKIILGITVEIRAFGEIINQTLLYETPIFIIMGTTLIISMYAASKGIETRARLSEILIYIVGVFSIFVILLLAINSDFSNLAPFLTTNNNTLLKSAFFTTNSFVGLEYGLLIYPFLLNKKDARKSAVYSVFIYGIILTIFTILSIASFGDTTLKRQLWPVLDLINTLDLPGSFVERHDAFVVSFWFLGVFTTVTSGLFFLAILLKDIFDKGSHSFYIFISALTIYLLAVSVTDIVNILLNTEIISFALNIFYSFLLPIVIIATAKLKKVGDHNV